MLAQVNIPEGVVYPDTLWSNTDSFYIASSTFEQLFAFPISKEDTINLGEVLPKNWAVPKLLV